MSFPQSIQLIEVLADWWDMPLGLPGENEYSQDDWANVWDLWRGKFESEKAADEAYNLCYQVVDRAYQRGARDASALLGVAEYVLT